jgi:hypothetical protein
MSLEQPENSVGKELTLQPDEPRRRGRPKGSLGTKAKLARAIVEELDFDPLRFLLRVAKNKRYDINLRVKAASDCLNVIHPRLASQHISAKVDTRAEHTEKILFAVDSDPFAIQKAEELFLLLHGIDVDKPIPRRKEPLTIEAEKQPL